MLSYVLKRLTLVPITLFGILCLNFVVVQWAPGGPVERMIGELQGLDGGGDLGRLSAGTDTFDASQQGADEGLYRGGSGLDPAIIKQVEKMYGFDKPLWTRFWSMLGRYLRLDLGESYFKRKPVGQLLLSKLPVSISLGFWSVLLVYAVSISLGVAKARRHGRPFDTISSIAVILGYAVPGFLFGLLLIILFAGGSFWSIFPLHGLTSQNAEMWPLGARIADYFWHMVLPLCTQVLGGFASLTLLTKNAFLEELSKPYVTTARAKGLPESKVLYHHVFRNALLVLAVGFPGMFLHMFFTGALLTEVLFSLDGLGLLGYQSMLMRDYPVIFGTLFVFTLFSMLLHLFSDLLYMKIDPRVHFEQGKA